jgi:hypothetical protein
MLNLLAQAIGVILLLPGKLRLIIFDFGGIMLLLPGKLQLILSYFSGIMRPPVDRPQQVNPRLAEKFVGFQRKVAAPVPRLLDR